MTVLSWPEKYGVEVLDYELDWTDALDSDTITGEVTVTVTNSTSVEIENVSTTDGITTVWISGGGDRKSRFPRVHLVAETAGGRTIAATVELPIQAP